MTIGLVTTAYQGNLAQCEPLPDPTTGRGFSIAVTVESVQAKAFPVNGVQQLETWVHVDRTDVTPNCGLMVNFRSLTERPHLQSGMKLRIASRTVQRTDSDIPGINAVSTDSGQLLYALVLSASPARFVDDLGDLVPGLTVAAGTTPLCTDMGGAQAFSAALAAGEQMCWLDSQTSRCCALWGADYEVQLLNATAAKGSANVQVGFAVRAKDFFYTPN